MWFLRGIAYVGVILLVVPFALLFAPMIAGFFLLDRLEHTYGYDEWQIKLGAMSLAFAASFLWIVILLGYIITL